MTRDEWLRIKSVSVAALEQPEAARRDFVATACAGDEALAREVLSLVASAETAAPLYEQVTFAAPASLSAMADAARPSPLRTGERVGAYRILREIGRGGMGTVFLAE